MNLKFIKLFLLGQISRDRVGVAIDAGRIVTNLLRMSLLIVGCLIIGSSVGCDHAETVSHAVVKFYPKHEPEDADAHSRLKEAMRRIPQILESDIFLEKIATKLQLAFDDEFSEIVIEIRRGLEINRKPDDPSHFEFELILPSRISLLPVGVLTEITETINTLSDEIIQERGLGITDLENAELLSMLESVVIEEAHAEDGTERHLDDYRKLQRKCPNLPRIKL